MEKNELQQILEHKWEQQTSMSGTNTHNYRDYFLEYIGKE